jgi:hypothetical protein
MCFSKQPLIISFFSIMLTQPNKHQGSVEGVISNRFQIRAAGHPLNNGRCFDPFFYSERIIHHNDVDNCTFELR